MAKKGQEAIKIVIRERPDLILLDVNMPGMSGFEVYSKIRVLFEGPIIMVTVRNSEHDRIVALDSGADDVVVKPFAIGELLARIRAALRRCTSEEPLPKIDTPELKVDLDKRMVDVFGKKVQLSLKKFDLLRLLVIQRGKVLTHERVLQAVWGPDHAGGVKEPSCPDKSAAQENRERSCRAPLHRDRTCARIQVSTSKRSCQKNDPAVNRDIWKECAVSEQVS